MADEAGQKAMLYFIEVLMNSNSPLSISVLTGRFATKSFTPEMRAAAGGNEDGLKAFLAKYPSLFRMQGDMVSVNNHGASIPSISEETGKSPSFEASVEAEQNAVMYFKDKLLKKGGRLPVKSLAGHLSQAPLEIRNAVGPQNEFRDFLVKYKKAFTIWEGEVVSLTDDKSMNPFLEKTGSESFPESFQETPAKSPTKEVKKATPITMTASEYKTMKFIKDLIEANDGQIAMHAIIKRVPDASDAVKNIICQEIGKLVQFVNKFPNIFTLNEDLITLRKTRLNVIMAGSRPPCTEETDSTISPPSKLESESISSSLTSSLTESLDKSSKPHASRTLSNHKGPVYHLAKLWGIVDLGKHEHVFFDRSILPDGYDDLAKSFRIGEILRFNAVRAARGSRARWRATHIWRDGQDIRSMYGADSTFSLTGFNSSALDEELKQLLPDPIQGLPHESYAYVDASQSSTGCIPVWTTNSHPESGDDKGVASLSMVPESKYMHKSVMKDSKLIPGYMLVPTVDTKMHKPNLTNGIHQQLRDIACQTISTGDIMATQLYQDEE